MREMILDTSTNLLYISFVEDKKIIYEVMQEGKNNHSDNLLALIEKGLKETSLQVKDFDKFIVGIGPGAYTGLRVSLTVAKMFAWTLNKPLYTISSIDLLTSGAIQDGTYAVMFKAKNNYSYTKIFMIEKGKYQLLQEETFLENVLFEKKILEYPNIKLLDNHNITINCLNISNKTQLVTEIHGLEPNYLRSEL